MRWLGGYAGGRERGAEGTWEGEQQTYGQKIVCVDSLLTLIPYSPLTPSSHSLHLGIDGFQMYPVYQMIDLRLLGEEDAGTSPPFFSLEGSSFLAHDGYGALHSPPSLTTAAAAAAAVSTTQRRRNNIRAATYVGVRMGVVLFSSVVAYLVPEFELLVALVGSIGAGMLAFIMPGVLGWTMYRETATRREKGGYGCLIAFGVVGGGIGAGYALHDLIYGQSQC